ncbi:MAG TPA: hypothetical protein VGM39_23565 [Kofleriaceae bacterium]
MKRALIAIALLVGACGKFETESIALDLRVLAIKTQVDDELGHPTNEADLVLDVDMDTIDLESLRSQLRDVDVTALVTDPGERRSLRYTWSICKANDDGRCDPGEPSKTYAEQELDDDPENVGGVAQRPHLTIPLRGDIGTQLTVLGIIQSDIQKNPVDAVGGVDIDFQLRIGGLDADPAKDVYATKKLRIAPRIPAGRQPNTNPSLDHLDGSLDTATQSGIDTEVLQPDDELARCGADMRAHSPVLDPGDVITLFPQNASAFAEQYVTPGLDGSTIMETETLSFQWVATRGSWSDETTGGGHDILGNQSLLGSDWKSPNINGTDDVPVQIWMIERDERYGVNWIETCIYAAPATP